MESPRPSTENSAGGFFRNPGGASRRKVVACVLVFAAALGVRLLGWHDVRGEVGAVQTAVTDNYKHMARLLLRNGAASFYDPASTTAEPDLLGHPPGYSFVLAALYGIFGESDSAAQMFQMACDSLAAVLVFLIAAELLTFGVACVAGASAALSPQFGWNSVLLLPDTLAVLPLLLAVYLLVRAGGRGVLVKAFAAGLLVGLSCWLRANALLLAPFLILALPFVLGGASWRRPALLLAAGAVLAVAPMTIRNALVFGRFIPVSLGAGQTLVEGIADYDPERRFGLPDTDMELIRQEAEAHGRPEYAQALFTPDGFERDRERLRRGLSVVRSNPLWFASVMARRAASMLRLERTPLASTAKVSEGWTRAPRLAARAAQKLFITAVFLPLLLLGLFALARAKRLRALAALLAVPLYYFCVQSALHTEYRYVLAIHYFLFIVAAAGLCHATDAARRKLAHGGRKI